MAHKTDILKLNVENLADEQYKALVAHAIGQLKLMRDCIVKGELQNADAMLTESPSGDGYGCDNSYLDMSIEGVPDMDDLSDVITKLQSLDKAKGE